METTKIPPRNIPSKPRITLPIFIILGELKTVYQRVRTISMSTKENRECPKAYGLVSNCLYEKSPNVLIASSFYSNIYAVGL
jgi:hypothetical protein